MPETSWQLQDAKARFSDVFSRARSEGPQVITRRDDEAEVMMSEEQYQRLVGKAHQPEEPGAILSRLSPGWRWSSI